MLKKILENGVTLHLYKNPNMKKMIVNYGVLYGSNGCYYNFYLNNKLHHVLPGCAHFLEHLLGEHSKYGSMFYNFLFYWKG